jgi:hypothetical protein
MLTAIGFLTVIATGLLAGALLTEACVLVPYWKGMPTSEFLRLHHTMSSSLFRYFAPLTIAGTTLPIAYSAITLCTNTGSNPASLICGACGIGLLAFYFGFFRKANLSFATEDNPRAAATTLARWAKLHAMRSGVAGVGFIASIVAYSS